MIDRRKVAPVLLVLGAGLAGVGTFRDMYRVFYPGFGGPSQTVTTTLWIVTTEPATGMPQDAFYAVGGPVIGAAVLMVVAAVLGLRERTSFVGRPAAMAAAGALAGIVLTFVLQVRQQKETMSSWPGAEGQLPQLTFLGGTYLLVVAAVIGLVGAVLAQQRPRFEEQEVAADEDAVVVHQLDSDDDTPPFGIAIPGEEQQETR